MELLVKSATNSLFKFKTALAQSGLTVDEQIAALKRYELAIEQINKKRQLTLTNG